jgi:hypothetical protein
MSNPESRILPHRPKVIAKAFRSEPVQVRVTADCGDVVQVCGEREDVTLGLLRSAVYRFDESLYGKLRKAFQNGDANRLSQLWDSAEAFDAADVV